VTERRLADKISVIGGWEADSLGEAAGISGRLALLLLPAA
jgi:hypothetical protein